MSASRSFWLNFSLFWFMEPAALLTVVAWAWTPCEVFRTCDLLCWRLCLLWLYLFKRLALPCLPFELGLLLGFFFLFWWSSSLPMLLEMELFLLVCEYNMLFWKNSFNLWGEICEMFMFCLPLDLVNDFSKFSVMLWSVSWLGFTNWCCSNIDCCTCTFPLVLCLVLKASPFLEPWASALRLCSSSRSSWESWELFKFWINIDDWSWISVKSCKSWFRCWM